MVEEGSGERSSQLLHGMKTDFRTIRQSENKLQIALHNRMVSFEFLLYYTYLNEDWSSSAIKC